MGGNNVPSVSVVSSFEKNSFSSTLVTSSSDPPYEPYRSPIISHERTNPFDKNKTPTYNNEPSGIYSSMSSKNTTSTAVLNDKTLKDVKLTEKFSTPLEPVVEPLAPSFTTSSGFDYSYRPQPLPIFTSKDSVEKADTKQTEVSAVKSETRHKFERKLSDADIVFGSKPEPYTSSFKVENYSRNRSNSSFTSSSTDSNFIFGQDAQKDNSFQKSLSVTSDTDGDYSYDPSVIAAKTFQGISNDAFSDYDTPKSTTVRNKSWSNSEDDDYDLK